MSIFAIITNLRFQDILDILFLTFVAYYLYLWFRGTKAFKALVGLLVLGIVFTMARAWGLFMTTWVFQIFWQVLIIFLIILFQSEIRQVLERVNPLKAIGFHKIYSSAKWIPAFTAGIFTLANRKMGALLILERADRVEEWITGGTNLNGEPNPELLISIFHKGSPLHDGAAIIRGGKVEIVSCYLPLSSRESLPKEWGTRHRAALGLTEKCDAWVIVISEESGDVSLARGGEMIHLDDQNKFSQLVREAIVPISHQKRTWKMKVRSLFIHRWPIKIGSLGLVSLLWLLLAGQQDFEVNFRVPLELKNLPAGMEILGQVEPQVQITVRGLRKDASMLSERNVHAELDLTTADLGKKSFPITRNQILLPNDRIQVIQIEPSQVEFEFKGKR